jgi:hypothetical protein
MLRLFKRFLVFVFLAALSLLTLFYVPREWYGHWMAAWFVWLIVALLVAWKSVPSSRQERLIVKTAEGLKGIMEMEEQVRTESRQLEMECPSCHAAGSFWSFLDNFKCRSCGSDLFAARVREKGDPWLELLAKRERIQTFYEKTPPWLLRKGKNRAS